MGARDGGVVDELRGVPCAERCQKSLSTRRATCNFDAATKRDEDENEEDK